MTTTNTTCKVTTCSFHHPEDRCAAGEIMVALNSGNAFCDTFVARDDDTQPTSTNSTITEGTAVRVGAHIDEEQLGVNLGNVGHLYEGYASNLTPVVACNATDCQYNKHEVCYASGIIIDGEDADTSQSTECGTYSPQ